MSRSIFARKSSQENKPYRVSTFSERVGRCDPAYIPHHDIDGKSTSIKAPWMLIRENMYEFSILVIVFSTDNWLVLR